VAVDVAGQGGHAGVHGDRRPGGGGGEVATVGGHDPGAAVVPGDEVGPAVAGDVGQQRGGRAGDLALAPGRRVGERPGRQQDLGRAVAAGGDEVGAAVAVDVGVARGRHGDRGAGGERGQLLQRAVEDVVVVDAAAAAVGNVVLPERPAVTPAGHAGRGI